MIFLIKEILSVIVNQSILISQFDNPNNQLNTKENNKLRLSTLVPKDYYDKNESNVAVIEPDGMNYYKVRFGNDRYMYKKKDPGVVAIPLDSPIATKKGKEGFTWSITEKEGVYTFKNVNNCLSIKGPAENKDNKYVQGMKCTNGINQKFRITEAPSKPEQKEEPSEEIKEIEGADKSTEQKSVNINLFLKKDHHGRSHHHHHRGGSYFINGREIY